MVRLMIIGESPSNTRPPGQEDVPFSGRTSIYLWNELAEYGIGREHCLVTNVVEEQCPKGELLSRVEENLPRLQRLADQWKPHAILVFGKFATEALLQRKLKFGLLPEVGQRKAFAEHPMFPCVHPGALGRNANLKEAFQRGIYHAIRHAMEQKNEADDARRDDGQ